MSEEVLMKSPRKALYDQVKGFLKRIPVVQRLLRQKGKFINNVYRIRTLSDLIKEGKVVIFHPYSRDENNGILTSAMVQEEMKEWLDLYGIKHLRRAKAAAIDSPAGAILMFVPIALLRIPASHEEYISQIRKETRNMIRKAESQGYEFKEFVWNDHLDEIFEVNTSKEVRQSEPMRGWYSKPVQPRHHSNKELRY